MSESSPEKFLQPKITGYRQLTEEEANLMNEIKHHGANLEALIEKLKLIPNTDKRWISIGATDLQKGLMALTRSVARPNSF